MNDEFSSVEFAMNPEPRCPCILLLDTSSSMSGDPINELNAGLDAFHESLSEDELAMLRVEISIITFGGSVDVKQDFTTANNFRPPVLEASGNTPMGSAINLALNKVEERKEEIRQNQMLYYRPWVFMITDGHPTDGNTWQIAAKRVHELESQKKLVFFAVGVEGADMNILGEISSRQPLKLIGLNFGEMFLWLSTSLISVSNSRPGEDVPLQSPLGWGKV